MESLPLEILDVIASNGGYRGLLCFRRFTDSLTVSRRTDFMVELGYSIKITRIRIVWTYNGKLHRTDGPAIEYYDEATYWYMIGKRHRIDGPAVEYPDGTKYWYLDDEYHRINGPAIEHSDGTKFWYVHGILHRIDGPAIEWSDGTKQWFVNGVRQNNN